MIVKTSIVCLALLASVSCLTKEEAAYFKNSGLYGGSVKVEEHDTTIVIEANGLPDHITQRVNPNIPQAHTMRYTFEKNPTISASPGCLHGGTIGMTRTGVAIYDPLDNTGENAVEGGGAERFDSCDGHPDQHGIYHYHKIPDSCLYKGEVDEFIGVALDGFPIYGPRVSDMSGDITNKDLDACHGRMFNGSYRYHVNNEFPYFLGCFKGNPIANTHTRHICTSTSQYDAEWGYVCTCNTPGNNQQLSGQHQPSGQFSGQQHFPGQPSGQQQISSSQLSGQQQLSPNQLSGQQQLSPNQLSGQQQLSPNQQTGQLLISPNQQTGQQQISPEQHYGQYQPPPDNMYGHHQPPPDQLYGQHLPPPDQLFGQYQQLPPDQQQPLSGAYPYRPWRPHQDVFGKK